MNIYFVRHGQTEENVKHTYFGALECDLNDAGIEQAKSCGEILKDIRFSRVYISERNRTLQTAKIIAPHGEVIKDSRINERDFGVFEGKSYEEIKVLYPEECKSWQEDWKEFSPPTGESYVKFYERVKAFIEHLKTVDEENILVVTHGGVIRTAYCYILDENLDFYWRFASKNGDISVIKYEENFFYIDSIIHV